MAGGIIQLIAYGPQDIYLTHNPHITYFKVVYRRHTNFSVQQFEKTFNDNPTFGKKASVKLYRLGDLATKMHVRVVLAGVPGTSGANFAWTRKLGHFLFRDIEISIGGQTVDRHYNHWVNIWYELTYSDHKDRGHRKNIGDVPELISFDDQDKPQYVLNIPFNFWFNRYYGLALPLIAIRYHEIFIKITLEEVENLIIYNDNFTDFDSLNILEMGLVTDYVYLDLDERKNFAIDYHEYLMEQVQYLGETPFSRYDISKSIDFKHPVKEIIWALSSGNYSTGQKFLFYTHKDDWTEDIPKFSKTILDQSLLVLRSGEEEPPQFGDWEEFGPSTEGSTTEDLTEGSTTSQSFKVINQSLTHSIWINASSLKIGDYNITGKIGAEILLTPNNILNITNLTSTINIRDLSYPVSVINDTRVNVTTDVYVNLHHNYGVYIDGSVNPLSTASLEYNGQPRFEKRNGLFFGVLQPYRYHSHTPTDGINLYSFADIPETLQPTGASNMSTIDTIYLHISMDETINEESGLPPLDLLNIDNRLYVYAFSYNIFRAMAGLTGVKYNE